MCGRPFPSRKFCAGKTKKAQIQSDNSRKNVFSVCGKNKLTAASLYESSDDVRGARKHGYSGLAKCDNEEQLA
jgi:hypothetical protein